jgi:urocanate hydratase
VGNGGGVGIGQSIHSGMVVVADGTELAERKLARTFWSDPALGIARYVDAGYEAATEQARRSAVTIPALEVE